MGLDVDDNGSLDVSEIAALMERPALGGLMKTKGETAEDLMRIMDRDQDGKISFEEFEHALRGDLKKDPPKLRLTARMQATDEPEAADEASPKPSPTPPQVGKDNSELVLWKATTLSLNSFAELKQRNIQTRQLFYAAMNQCIFGGICFSWIPCLFFVAAPSLEDDECETF